MAETKLERVHHQLKFRIASVRKVEDLTPRMRRIILHTPEFEGFTSPGYDDHVRLFFAPSGSELEHPVLGDRGLEFPGGLRPEGRDYTPRHFDPVSNDLTIDFVLHGDGPATRWAEEAKEGATVGVGGPRASFLLREAFDWYLLVGDETAIPAIARRLEELADAKVVAFVEVADEAEMRPIGGRAHDLHWVSREGVHAGHDQRLLQALRDASFPEGRAYAFVAGEAELTKAIRRHLIEDRGFGSDAVKAAGYWRHGEQNFYDGHEH